MINVSELRKRLSEKDVDALINECINLSYFISNCEDVISGRKIYGMTVSPSDLICSSNAISLMSECANVSAEKKRKRLLLVNEFLKHEQESKKG